MWTVGVIQLANIETLPCVMRLVTIGPTLIKMVELIIRSAVLPVVIVVPCTVALTVNCIIVSNCIISFV